jgi:hypothetical protein
MLEFDFFGLAWARRALHAGTACLRGTLAVPGLYLGHDGQHGTPQQRLIVLFVPVP